MAESSRMRIGDAERDDAVALLGEHLAAGRVDYAEFEQRTGMVLAARTQGELDAVFDDLPGRRPGERDASPASPVAPVGPVSGGGWSPVPVVGERGMAQPAGTGARWPQAAVMAAMATACFATVWWLAARGATFAPFIFLSYWWMGPLARRGHSNTAADRTHKPPPTPPPADR